jgi:hypothetical protein
MRRVLIEAVVNSYNNCSRGENLQLLYLPRVRGSFSERVTEFVTLQKAVFGGLEHFWWSVHFRVAQTWPCQVVPALKLRGLRRRQIEVEQKAPADINFIVKRRGIELAFYLGFQNGEVFWKSRERAQTTTSLCGYGGI